MKLHTKILIGLLAGAALGIAANLALGGEHPSVVWFNRYVAGPVGQVFLRMLFMIVMPLVFASIALGVAGIGDVRKLGRMGGRAIGYFVATTGLAAALGLVAVNLVRPGAAIPSEVRDQLRAAFATDASAKIESAATSSFGIETLVNIVTRNPLKSAVDFDMLGVIFFGLVFGVALTTIERERAQPMLAFLESLNAVVVAIVDLAMRLAPWGVAGLIFGVSSRFGFVLLKPLGLYVALVLAALGLHVAVTLSLIVRYVIGLRPMLFLSRIRSSILTAFSTSSSSASLPTNLAVAHLNLGVPPRIAGFVFPVGSTMCMNGTALFEGITVLFLCQMFGIELALGQQLAVVAMAVITAIGAAGVPGGSIPLLVGILGMFGVPGDGIAVVLGVDRILDMARTAVNVIGDHTATLYVARSEGAWTPADLPVSSAFETGHAV